jgi:hypothetical protein
MGNETLISKPGATLQVGGINREFGMTDQMSSYYREMPVASRVKATLPHMSNTDMIALRRFKDGTLHFECDNGPVYTISNAATANLGDLSNGDVDIEFGGDPAAL